MTVVTFTADVFPHTKDSVVDLSDEEKARVDEQVKLRNLDRAYVSGDHAPTEEESRDARAAADHKTVVDNMVDQAAQLEAQRNAVAEPANIEALGVKAEEPVVVTGTEPVADVEVANPQEAVDTGSGEGAQVKSSKKK